jgi:hypothetical protein
VIASGVTSSQPRFGGAASWVGAMLLVSSLGLSFLFLFSSFVLKLGSP